MTLSESKTATEELLNGPRTVLMLGAGFSKWSCNLPLISELFDFKVRAYNDAEENRIARLKKLYEVWRAENPTEHCEAFILSSQGPPDRFNLTNWYISRRLSEPFIVHGSRRYTWYINSYHPHQHDGIEKVRGLIAALSGVAGSANLGILTTNYDLIPEYALGTRGFNYGIPFEQIGFTPYPYPQPVRLTGAVPIAKLHGSISWTQDAKFADSRCGLTGKCLIVPPVTEKKAPALLKNELTRAAEMLSKCDCLIVFGFSFNEYDVAIRNFFQKNISDHTDVVFIDVVDHRKRLLPIFGDRKMSFLNAVEVTTASLVKLAYS